VVGKEMKAFEEMGSKEFLAPALSHLNRKFNLK
jgi:hypothetical protein